MEIVEGGDFGGEKSGRATHPDTAGVGSTNSKAANQITGATTEWNASAFVSSALSRALGGVFWQHACVADISICPHWLLIVRQQARSSALICISETMQAIAGARYEANSKASKPNLQNFFIPAYSISELRTLALIER
jgi:hypothetical protein